MPTGWGVELPFERALVLSAVRRARRGARVRPAAPAGPAAVARAVRARRGRVHIALGALVGLFAAFVALQFATLFGGTEHVLDTTGLTYAEYARSGFAQLLAVAALTFAVLAAARRWARPHRLLLAALCVLTLVVLASALKRLGLYEETYGFTRLRLAAHAALLYLGALFCLVLVTRSRAGRWWRSRRRRCCSSPSPTPTAGSPSTTSTATSARARSTSPTSDARARTRRPRSAGVVAQCVDDDGLAGFNLARAAARRTSTAHRTAASARCDPPRPTR